MRRFTQAAPSKDDVGIVVRVFVLRTRALTGMLMVHPVPQTASSQETLDRTYIDALVDRRVQMQELSRRTSAACFTWRSPVAGAVG